MATTLFIDDSNIRLLVTKGKRVQKWARLPLEPGLVRDGVIIDEDQVVDQLRELFKLQKVSARKVIAGISGLNSLYRLITLPELPEAVRAEAVRHEARRVIPVSLDQMHLAYQALPGPPGETRLFLAAFPRNTTDALIRTLRQAGVEPYLMDLAPLALCRTANEPRAIIVNVWSTNLDIVIMADRVPQVLRSLSLPGEATSLSEMLPVITEELERTITFYNSSHMESPLDSTVPILISGDLAEAPDTWQALAGKESYSVSILPSPIEFPEGFDPSQFMVNIGLALKELLSAKEANFSLVNLNTMPEIYLPKARHLGRTLIPIAVAIVGAGLTFYAYTLLQGSMAQTDALRVQLPPVQSQIAEYQKEIATLKEQIVQLEPQVAPLEATAGVFETTFASMVEVREQINEDLSRITGLVPADIALLYGGDKTPSLPGRLDTAEINHSVEEVMVTGVAPDEVADIFSYARALRSSGRFSMVVISSIEAYEETIEEEGVDEEDWETVRGYNFVFLLKR